MQRLEVSGARPIYGSLGVKGLIFPDHGHRGNLPLQGKFAR